jgi:hypothetical protein
MKIIFGLLGVLTLTLLALPLEAKEVYVTVMSEELFRAAQDLDSLDAIIRSGPDQIDELFKQSATQDGNLRLRTDQALVIKGGRGSIGLELDQYKPSIIFGAKYLKAYGCYKKRPIGRENTTYVIVSSGGFVIQNWCDQKLLISGGSINVGQLSTKVKAIPQQ